MIAGPDKQQIPPLRCAAVGMTNLWGYFGSEVWLGKAWAEEGAETVRLWRRKRKPGPKGPPLCPVFRGLKAPAPSARTKQGLGRSLCGLERGCGWGETDGEDFEGCEGAGQEAF
jgi:hypothetical protein